MASVILDAVEKRFGAVQALYPLDLAIRDGEFLSLLGPSGCGKTTTLNLIAGLEQPTAGHIAIGERDVTHTPAMHRDIAMVFQSYALYPHMTVFANMAFALRIRKLPDAEIRARVQRAAAMLGLEPLLERYPRALSGGQRQRVALGRAVVREPSVFLLDEPLSNLDAVLRLRTRAELSTLFHELGTTAIYVTHDQSEAMTMSDRIAVFEGGRLQQIGAPLEIYRNPANSFVASFVGSPPMSFLEVEVGETGCLFAGGHSLPLPEDAPVLQAGTKLRLGLRPEDIGVGVGDVPAKVRVLEHLGGLVIAHFETPFGSLMAQLANAAGLRPGGEVMLDLPGVSHYLFAADDSRALRTPGLNASDPLTENN